MYSDQPTLHHSTAPKTVKWHTKANHKMADGKLTNCECSTSEGTA